MNNLPPVGTNVKLIPDLTKYHPSLIPNVEGRVIGPALESYYDGRAVLVRFPKVTLDIFFSGLSEVIQKTKG